MITFRKIGPDTWGIQSDDALQTGATVQVSLKSGGSKEVIVGEARGEQYGKFVYATAPAPKKARETVAVGELGGVNALFAKAKTHLKWPAIVLSVPAINETIRITVAGPKSNVPGSLNVASDTRDDNYGRRFWYGRVHQDGKFEQRSPNAAIAERLAAFACDPVKIATEHARLTGRCCFCNIALKDERSTAAGYGKTCAGHFGLPWGERPVEFAAPVAQGSLLALATRIEQAA